MNFSFIHAADIHLGRPFSGVSDIHAHKNAVEKAFNNFINYALVKNVDFLLIAGDTFDSDEQDFESKLILKEGLKKLEAADIKVFLICGNHDPLYSYNKTTFNFDENSNIKIVGLNTNTYEDFTVTDKNNNPIAVVHALSFQENIFKENPTKYFSPANNSLFNIGLLHCDIDASKESPYAPCTKSELEALKYDYLALGHIHKPSELYVGTLQGRNTKETGEHGIRHIKVENGQIVKNTFVNTDVIRFEEIEIDLTNAQDTTSAAILIQEQLQSLTNINCEFFYIKLTLKGFVDYYREINTEFFDTTREKIKANSNGKIYLSEIFNELVANINEDDLKDDEGMAGTLYRTIQENENIENSYTKIEEQLKHLLKDCNFSEEEYSFFETEIKNKSKESCKNLCMQIYKNESKKD